MAELLSDLLLAARCVNSQPFFWNAMAWSTIMAMFFGAAIYDGEIPHAKRGISAVVAYAFMTMLVTGNYAYHRYFIIRPEVAYQLFIYPIQLLYLSFFWTVGFVGSIVLFRYLAKRKRR